MATLVEPYVTKGVGFYSEVGEDSVFSGAFSSIHALVSFSF